MLMPRAAATCNSSLATAVRFQSLQVGGEQAPGDFFFPVPGQTGKINLALVTEDAHHFPKASSGLSGKTGAGRLKRWYHPLQTIRSGRKARPLPGTVVLNYSFPALCAHSRRRCLHIFTEHLGVGAPPFAQENPVSLHLKINVKFTLGTND